jgi:hypothetical protein
MTEAAQKSAKIVHFFLVFRLSQICFKGTFWTLHYFGPVPSVFFQENRLLRAIKPKLRPGGSSPPLQTILGPTVIGLSIDISPRARHQCWSGIKFT